MTSPALILEDVTVRYRPLVDRTPTLRRALGEWRHRETEPITAVDNLSVQINKGEAFAVIGRNGAGKSTLLKVMARTLKPDEGIVRTYGKTSTLISLGVGFNPHLSGRRNVYLGGLAAGLKKAEIEDRFDSIVDYAELWEAIDRPMKTYSSGMYSRLAFSVAMALDPEILLLDEVMAVGDEEFQAKSMQALKDLLDRAGTLVFVSHALNMVTQFCDRALWLDSGQVKGVGSAEEMVGLYREDVQRLKRERETPA